MPGSFLVRHRSLGLRGKLLVLLLAFGVVPVIGAIGVGFAASRTVILRQAAQALEALAAAQAVHLATELDRERLLLRTIAGQLPPEGRLERMAPPALAQLLIQSLPEGGVFDGLRIVTSGGRVLASVALRNTAPHWPDGAPATDWHTRRAVVHRDADLVLAYLVAVPIGEGPKAGWLEGHVRVEDFRRALSIPEHLMTGVVAAVIERDGRPVFGAHEQVIAVIPSFTGGELPAATVVARLEGGALVVTAPVQNTDWVFAAVLPVQVALAPLARLRDSALAGAAVLVLLIVLTGLVAARSVTTPLLELAGSARRFGQEGQYEAIPARTADEVGDLVTALNTMAANLARSREQLEMLHARDLERAQQLATVGELASGVAHEIRNPLTAVRGALQLALRGLATGAEARPLLTEAEQQLQRIETATTQLLHYARPPELREIVAEPNLLVERAVTIVAPRAASAGITLRPELAGSPLLVRVDPELMVQVLVNLMLNGVEAMEPGGELTVWVARHAPEVWIGVRDTGQGIPDASKGDVFRPFFTTKHQGTGLGLSISRQIVLRHGGSLWVEDTPGGGATFVVALPLVEERGSHDG